MQNIDFLPAKYREATAERRTRYYGVLVMGAFLSLLGVAFAGQCALEAHVERELDHVREQYTRVLAHSTRLTALEQERIPCDAEAQLNTLLRQPWPRTQILTDVLAVLPEPITLVKLSIERQVVSGAAVSAIPANSATGAAQEEKLLPAQRDLRRLTQESKTRETVVDLEGITDDALTLHTYLGKLASLGLFSAAELTSIDKLEKSSMSRFKARLIVRRGHVDAPSSPSAARAEVAQTGAQGPQKGQPMNYLRRQSWLVTASLVLMAAGYVWFIFLPGKAAIGQLEAELNQRRAFVAEGHNIVRKIESLERELALTRCYSQKWRPEHSGSAQAAARFGRIAHVLQQAGVSTTRFAPEAAIRLDSLEKLPLRISCTGSFGDICGMLAQLENLDERCWIEQLTLEQASQDGQAIECELGLAIFADNSKKSD